MKVTPVLRNRKNKDGSQTINIRVNEGNKKTYIPVGAKIHKSYWDPKGYVKSNYKDSDYINKKINSIIRKYDKSLGSMDNFITYWEDYNEHLLDANSIGTYRRMKTSLNCLKLYIGEKLVFADIDHDFVKNYYKWLEIKYDNYNTIGANIKKFKKIVNDARSEGLITLNPFDNFTIKTQPTVSKSLTDEQFERLAERSIVHNKTLEKYRLVFLAMYQLQGIRVSDFLTLKFSNINQDTITYKMRKTGKSITIGITPTLKKIIRKLNLRRYNDVNVGGMFGDDMIKLLVMHHSDDYIFPFIKKGIEDTNEKKTYQYILVYTSLINKYFKQLGHNVGTNKLSSHTARHTYSRRLLKNGTDMMSIMKSLNHHSLTVTQSYLDSLTQDEVIDKNIEMYDKDNIRV